MKNDVLFVVILGAYTFIFIIVNRLEHYHWKEIIMFILFFGFGAFFAKSLVVYEVVTPMDIVQNGVGIGVLE